MIFFLLLIAFALLFARLSVSPAGIMVVQMHAAHVAEQERKHGRKI